MLLPEAEMPVTAKPCPTTIGLLAACLRHAEEHPNETLLVAGHTDTKSKPGHNLTLSELRAKCAHAALVGDRGTFISVAKDRHKPEDEKQILRWADRCFDWHCNPDDYPSAPSTTTYHFHQNYNKSSNKEPHVCTRRIDETWVFMEASWGAVYDCYQYQPAQDLGIETSDLPAFRADNLRFVFSDRNWIGCGEYHPVDERYRDEYRSASNRRVEAMFFRPGDQPDPLACNVCDASVCASCPLYSDVLYRRDILPAMPSAKPWWAVWEKWLEPAKIDTKRTMLLIAEGLPDGETITFQVENQVETEISSVGSQQSAQSVGQQASRVNAIWFDEQAQRPIPPVDVNESTGFSKVQFRFIADGAGRHLVSNWLDYRDELFLQFSHLTQSRLICNHDYICYSPWGTLRGRTNATGQVHLTALPPGGARVLLAGYRIYDLQQRDAGITISRQLRIVQPPFSGLSALPQMIWQFTFEDGVQPSQMVPPTVQLCYQPGGMSYSLTTQPLAYMPARWRGELPQEFFHQSMVVEVHWRDMASIDHIAKKTFRAGNRLNTDRMVKAYVDEHMLLIGHRGSPQRMVENTMESYAAALAVDRMNPYQPLRNLSPGQSSNPPCCLFVLT